MPPNEVRFHICVWPPLERAGKLPLGMVPFQWWPQRFWMCFLQIYARPPPFWLAENVWKPDCLTRPLETSCPLDNLIDPWSGYCFGWPSRFVCSFVCFFLRYSGFNIYIFDSTIYAVWVGMCNWDLFLTSIRFPKNASALDQQDINVLNKIIT